MNDAVSEVAKVQKRCEKWKVKSEKFGAAEKKCCSFVLMSEKKRNFVADNQPIF